MKIIKIENGRTIQTLDLEVENTHSYQLENGAVTHNTSSLVLGTSSGIHAWHNEYYIRRLRVGKDEAIYKYLIKEHPEIVEDEYFKPHQQAVISIPQKAPNNAITRQESALELLKRVESVYKNWIIPGHRSGVNKNNVSTTVTIKPNEWEEVGKWMWENRNSFTALSVLPYSDHSYIQAPYEDCSEFEYYQKETTLHNINLNDIVELDDSTTQRDNLACAAGGCEL